MCVYIYMFVFVCVCLRVLIKVLISFSTLHPNPLKLNTLNRRYSTPLGHWDLIAACPDFWVA